MHKWILRIIAHESLGLGVGGILFPFFIPWMDMLHEKSNLYQPYLLIFSLLMVVAGITFFGRIHQSVPGILINPRWIAILYDMILFFFSLGSSLMVITWIFMQLNSNLYHGSDDYLIFMGIYFLFIGIPFVSWYIHRLTTQSIIIDQEQIILYRSNEKSILKWKDLMACQLNDEHVMVGRAGMLIPRKLQDRLVLTGINAEELVINEPQIKSVKNKIIDEFIFHAPEEWVAEMSKLLRKW